ncbi:MAG TPA: hypothetical protein PLD84_11045 [Chitinophagales bacterium]|nr:hypothetical protein [Chitinophagales bacterium]
MERKNKPSRKRDNRYFGAFLGLVFPVIGFLLFYVFAFSDSMSLQVYWNQLFNTSKMSAALSLSIIMNLPVFFFFLSDKRYENVKGIVGATIFYGIFIILFKFF